MISVTAAANGVCRAHRHMGVHWKAVGSGRVALENDPPQTPLVSTCHKEKPSCRLVSSSPFELNSFHSFNFFVRISVL